MKFTTTASSLASLVTLAYAATTERTFAVLRFDGDGFMTEGRVDPVVSPGAASSHMHGIMGGSNFGLTVEGDDLLKSSCTNAKIKNDRSNYWAPHVYHQNTNGTFTKVPLFYMNVYYFFEPTDDEIEPFPVGLKMLSGNASTRTPPAFGGGSNLDPSAGPIQPIQFTCPRSSYNPPSYPANSDGTTAGMQDPNNKGAGAGFPLYPCDGYASPLRADIHFPSCYNPAAGLDDYKNNMAWPTSKNGKQNCPSGYTHVPHIFYELYWNTPTFDWTPEGKTQPFVLSNGDRTGYSLHADFIAGWNTDTLKTIIDTCNAGDSGMDKCPNIPGGLNTDGASCKITSPIFEPEGLDDALSQLPGNNPLAGWGVGSVSAGSSSSSSSSGSSASSSSTSGSASSSLKASASIGVSVGGQKAEAASTPATSASFATSSSTQTTKATTSTQEQDSPSGPEIYTVIDYITVTQTVYTEETAAARRRGHVRRHLRSGHN